MSDITKCAAANCQSAKTCYRKLAGSGTWQSYCDFSENKEIETCENYWEVDEKYNK